MLGLTLREEFRSRRLRGTTTDFKNSTNTGALEQPASRFLEITYPSTDLLKLIEATGSGKTRPVVLMGGRGLGKTHLMATLYHVFTDLKATQAWLNLWAKRLSNPSLSSLKLRESTHVIAESLHLQNYKFLWDLIFDKHPKGEFIRGKWAGLGDKKTDIPSYDLLVELFSGQPTVMILDEFQTWYEGLTNTKQFPWRNWAFNFIQILSEVAQHYPELLVLVVSVRSGDSDAYQQIHRVNPVLIDFKGPYAKRDRQRLLLHRLFKNRMQIPSSEIEGLISTHVHEYLRLNKIPESEHHQKDVEFVEAWPFAPHLLGLLEDQVLIATDAQETRDLIRILADLYKGYGESTPVITAASFRLDDEKSGIAALLDSVANQHHRNLREKALRNLESVLDVVKDTRLLKHASQIISALWLRSIAIDKLKGATASTLQIDVTEDNAMDDNAFQAELSTIVSNSFNIHEVGNRLVFMEDENPASKLMAFARNDKLFTDGSDIDQLAKEIRYIIGGSEDLTRNFRVVVLKKRWQVSPWDELDERDHPNFWEGRIPIVVVPECPEKIDPTLGKWLKEHIATRRNTVRFLLPKEGNVYYNREIIILTRAVLKSAEWKGEDPKYPELNSEYRKELHNRLINFFNKFALLDIWNFGDSSGCQFHIINHGSEGNKIPLLIEDIIKRDIFVPEDFIDLVMAFSEKNGSVGQLLRELQEPRPGGMVNIPWLGEIEFKEKIIRLCADGRISLNVRGMEMLQVKPGELVDDAWNRMKGRLGIGKHLDETFIQKSAPFTATAQINTVESKDETPQSSVSDANAGYSDSSKDANQFSNIFDGQSGNVKPQITPLDSNVATSALNLVGKVENWGIGPVSRVLNFNLKITSLTGAQLQKLLSDLPEGLLYSISMGKEDN